MPTNRHSCIDPLPPRIGSALIYLLEAVDYAEQTDSDRWEFAVELDLLTQMGLTLNDYRWLVRKQIVEHQREVTLETDDGRAFRLTGDLIFPDRTCFILTDQGIALAREICDRVTTHDTMPSTHLENDTSNGGNRLSNDADTIDDRSASKPLRPHWDAERRLLQVNGTPVKHFKWSAENQEAILSAFEEEGWPSRVDDPLSPHPEQDSKRRLSDTIKCLNRKQDNPLLHFRGDGTGEGIVWEFVADNEATRKVQIEVE